MDDYDDDHAAAVLDPATVGCQDTDSTAVPLRVSAVRGQDDHALRPAAGGNPPMDRRTRSSHHSWEQTLPNADGTPLLPHYY